MRAGMERALAAWRQVLLSPLPAFVLLSAFLMSVHEPWRDEAQPWLIARDGEPTFLAEMDSEGSPGLWYALLWPLAELDAPFGSARVLHHSLALAAVSVLVLHGPFTRFEQWLVALSYFVLYEYNAVARSYVLVVLLLFVVASLWRRRLETPFVYALPLALLAQVSAHATLMAVALGAEMGVSALLARRRAAVLAAVVPVLGVLLAVVQMIPGEDLAEWRTRSNFEWAEPHFIEAGRGAVHAFFPVPAEGTWRWGWTWLDAELEPPRLIWAGALLYGLSLLPFLRVPRVLAVYAAGSLALLAVFYLKHDVSGQMRHHGMLFVFFLFCLWLARVDRPPRAQRGWRGWVGPIVLWALLAGHVTASAAALARDAEEPFSGGPGAAAFLVENGLAGDDVLIGVYPSFIGAPVLVHLDRETLYYPQTDTHGSYVRWTKEDADSFHMDRGLLVDRVLEEGRARDASRVVLLTSFPMGAPGFEERFTLLHVTHSLAPGDAVYVYEARSGAAPQS